jgi:hypothetical protein
MATHLPEAVLIAEAEAIVPLVIRALDIIIPVRLPLPATAGFHSALRREEPLDTPPLAPQVLELRDAVAGSALSCLSMLTRRSAGCLAPHLPSLAPLLLSLASVRLPDGTPNPYAGRPAVRAGSLECLRSLLVLPYHKLHPVRQAVIAGLVAVLDDPKRAVRRRAAACRSDWITLR